MFLAQCVIFMIPYLEQLFNARSLLWIFCKTKPNEIIEFLRPPRRSVK